jgi:succinate-acetate transporter protein
MITALAILAFLLTWLAIGIIALMVAVRFTDVGVNPKEGDDVAIFLLFWPLILVFLIIAGTCKTIHRLVIFVLENF